MLRSFWLCLLAAVALAGCATSSATYSSAAGTGPQIPSTPDIFTTAPRAPLHSELFACGPSGANLGEIGARGEATNYRPYIYTPAGALLRNPTETSCLSSGFGWRGVATGGGRVHNGIDLANPGGGFVYAAAGGWVAAASHRGGYGNVVEIDHGRGVRTLYAHLARIAPQVQHGVFVPEGAAIGSMGATGNATGVHLHYEVSVDGVLVDPLAYGVEPAPLM